MAVSDPGFGGFRLCSVYALRTWTVPEITCSSCAVTAPGMSAGFTAAAELGKALSLGLSVRDPKST